MAYTNGDVVERARHLTQDKEPPYRYDNALYMSYLTDALHEIRRIRPDLFVTVDGVVTSVDVDNIEVNLTIDGQYFTAVADYVGGMIALEDDKFDPEGKSVRLLSIFHNKLAGKI